MVTCFVCRQTIDDGGHAAQCPILIEQLRAIRQKAAAARERMS